jgi:hypothetical protein
MKTNNLGHVFEKHLLEAYLAENQTDPVTNESATVEDYVELKGDFSQWWWTNDSP